MLASLVGYFFCMITMLTAVVVLLSGFANISMVDKGRHHLRPPIDRTVAADETTQRHSPVAKEASSPEKDVSPVVPTAKADTKKTSTTNPKYSLVTPTTMAMGTRWVTPKKLDTAREVSFSADPAEKGR
jgi:hypothetical protein